MSREPPDSKRNRIARNLFGPRPYHTRVQTSQGGGNSISSSNQGPQAGPSTASLGTQPATSNHAPSTAYSFPPTTDYSVPPVTNYTAPRATGYSAPPATVYSTPPATNSTSQALAFHQFPNTVAQSNSEAIRTQHTSQVSALQQFAPQQLSQSEIEEALQFPLGNLPPPLTWGQQGYMSPALAGYTGVYGNEVESGNHDRQVIAPPAAGNTGTSSFNEPTVRHGGSQDFGANINTATVPGSSTYDVLAGASVSQYYRTLPPAQQVPANPTQPQTMQQPYGGISTAAPPTIPPSQHTVSSNHTTASQNSRGLNDRTNRLLGQNSRSTVDNASQSATFPPWLLAPDLGPRDVTTGEFEQFRRNVAGAPMERPAHRGLLNSFPMVRSNEAPSASFNTHLVQTQGPSNPMVPPPSASAPLSGPLDEVTTSNTQQFQAVDPSSTPLGGTAGSQDECPLSMAVLLAGALQTQNQQVLHPSQTSQAPQPQWQSQIPAEHGSRNLPTESSQSHPMNQVRQSQPLSLGYNHAAHPSAPAQPWTLHPGYGQPVPEAGVSGPSTSAATTDTTMAFLGQAATDTSMTDDHNDTTMSPGQEYENNETSDSTLTDFELVPSPEPEPEPARTPTPPPRVDEAQFAADLRNGTVNPARLRGGFALPGFQPPPGGTERLNRLRRTFQGQLMKSAANGQTGQGSSTQGSSTLGPSTQGSSTMGSTINGAQVNADYANSTLQEWANRLQVGRIQEENAALGAALVAQAEGNSSTGGSWTWAVQSEAPYLTLKTFQPNKNAPRSSTGGKTPRTAEPRTSVMGTSAAASRTQDNGDNGTSSASGASESSTATSSEVVTPPEPDTNNNPPSPGSSVDAEGSTDEECEAGHIGHNFRSFRAEIVNSATPFPSASALKQGQKSERKREHKQIEMTYEDFLDLAKAVKDSNLPTMTTNSELGTTRDKTRVPLAALGQRLRTALGVTEPMVHVEWLFAGGVCGIRVVQPPSRAARPDRPTLRVNADRRPRHMSERAYEMATAAYVETSPQLQPVGPAPEFTITQRRLPRLATQVRPQLAQMPADKWPAPQVPAQQPQQRETQRRRQPSSSLDEQAQRVLEAIIQDRNLGRVQEPGSGSSSNIADRLQNLNLGQASREGYMPWHQGLARLPVPRPRGSTHQQAESLPAGLQRLLNDLFPPSPTAAYPTPPPAYQNEDTPSGSLHNQHNQLAAHLHRQSPPGYHAGLHMPIRAPNPVRPPMMRFRPPTQAQLGPYRPPAGYYGWANAGPLPGVPGAPAEWRPLPTPSVNRRPPPPAFGPQYQARPQPTVGQRPHIPGQNYRPQRPSVRPPPRPEAPISPLALPAPAGPTLPEQASARPAATPPAYATAPTTLHHPRPLHHLRPSLHLNIAPSSPLVLPRPSPNTQRNNRLHEAAHRAFNNPPTRPGPGEGHAFINGAIILNRIVPDQVPGADVFPYGPRAENVAEPVRVLQLDGDQGTFEPNGLRVDERVIKLREAVEKEYRRFRRWLRIVTRLARSPRVSKRVMWRLRVYLARVARLRRAEHDKADKPAKNDHSKPDNLDSAAPNGDSTQKPQDLSRPTPDRKDKPKQTTKFKDGFRNRQALKGKKSQKQQAAKAMPTGSKAAESESTAEEKEKQSNEKQGGEQKAKLDDDSHGDEKEGGEGGDEPQPSGCTSQ